MIVVTAAEVAWFVGVFLVACAAMFGLIVLDDRATRREAAEDEPPVTARPHGPGGGRPVDAVDLPPMAQVLTVLGQTVEQLRLERDAAHAECAELASDLVIARTAHALELAELRPSIAEDLLAEVLEPCCEHDCAKVDEYDDDAPDDDSFICTQGHWHTPLIVCSAPVGHGATSFRRCPGGAQ